MRTRTTVTALAAAAAVALAPATAASADPGKGGGKPANPNHTVGLAGGGTEIVTFHADKPRNLRVVGDVTGLQEDTRLVGIDFRVQDGQLYGVGDRGGVYTVDTCSGAATLVLRLTVALEGERFGVDFNPAANALRIVSDTGQNLRQPFATPGAATIEDGDLSTPPAAGTTTGVTAAAYTNNDLDDSTATSLFVISGSSVALQSPANAGTLAATGSLGVEVTGDAGFDIRSTRKGGKTVENEAYATITVGGQARLFQVSLLTGAAQEVGTLAADVTDLALPLG
ncbi:DUF4394 domain-containing protein [Kineococcus terrestris]|uniref:DUF4394 domain-containing protein n=1 Tax=Kineococcus terrestris TaxID=2044856 RepID=UPI0034DB3FCB